MCGHSLKSPARHDAAYTQETGTFNVCPISETVSNCAEVLGNYSGDPHSGNNLMI